MSARLIRQAALRRDRQERGAVAIVFAIVVVLLFAMAAIGVDIASNVAAKQRLRDTLDLSAHAGAVALETSGAAAVAAALAEAKRADLSAVPTIDLWCVVAATPLGTVNEQQIPGACNPGTKKPYTAANYPGLVCDDTLCAIPCSTASSLKCNTIRVADSKIVPYAFAPAIGFKEGSTGNQIATACRGGCGSETLNPMDVVIMADRTASMEYNDRQMMKSAILESLKTMNPKMHQVAFGALHKSRETGHTLKSKAYGPQRDDYVVTYNTSCRYDCSQDSSSLLNYNGHWDGTGDTNGDNKCLTEASTKATASSATSISRWTSSKQRPSPGMSTTNVAYGEWVPVDFTNQYLLPKAKPEDPSVLNAGNALVDGVSCLPQSIAGEYGTHLAGALKGAVRYALDNNPDPARAGTTKVRKVVIFETDGMPDESSAFGNTLLTTGDLSGGGQPTTQGCSKFLDVAEKAKAADVLLIMIGFGDAATERCQKNPSGGRYVRDVLAEAASPDPAGNASTANSCRNADIAAENQDGDYFFCATSGADLADIFVTAVSGVGGKIRLIRLPG